jgi:hypothetical protein
MLRTLAVFIGGAILGFALPLALFAVIVYRVPEQFNFYSYFVLKVLVATAVGLFIGSLQQKRAGLLAVACHLPFLLWQATRSSYPVWTTGRIPAFLLGEAMGLSLTFAVAHHLSKSKFGRRTGSRVPQP